MRGNPSSVLVIGSGPAGLSASLALATQGFRVQVIDEDSLSSSSPATLPPTDALPLVVFGADHATLSMFRQLGTAKQVRFPSRLHYEFYAKSHRISRLRRPPAPASLRTMLSLATFPALTLRDRGRILSFLQRTWERDPPLGLDLEGRTADDWLDEIGQSEQARKFVWGPLARFLLGDELGRISARSFADALTRHFLSDIRSARIALPAEGLDRLFTRPAFMRLRNDRVSFHKGSAVKLLRLDAHGVQEVRLEDGHSLRSDWYVVDVPHHRLPAMLSERTLAHFAYFQQIGHLQDVPAVTVHLWLTDSLNAPRLLLLADHPFHWLTVRRLADKERTLVLASLVATGSNLPHDRSDPALIQIAVDLVTRALSQKNLNVRDAVVVRTARAHLALPPGTAALRPLPQSPLSNLFLAGSWTDTGLAGTTESAILSGKLCAEAILEQSRALKSARLR